MRHTHRLQAPPILKTRTFKVNKDHTSNNELPDSKDDDEAQGQDFGQGEESSEPGSNLQTIAVNGP